jgi:hypothetical protein
MAQIIAVFTDMIFQIIKKTETSKGNNRIKGFIERPAHQ